VVIHEQWCGIAAAVLGLPVTANLGVELKATRWTKASQSAKRDAYPDVVHFSTNRVLMRQLRWADVDTVMMKLKLETATHLVLSPWRDLQLALGLQLAYVERHL